MASISQAAEVRTRIHVQGIVQGVGFRPFVFNLVKRLGLRGFVLNSTSGVDMELEGEQTAIQQFLETLKQDPPPLALIESYQTSMNYLFLGIPISSSARASIRRTSLLWCRRMSELVQIV